jgi:hypothetical protein
MLVPSPSSTPISPPSRHPPDGAKQIADQAAVAANVIAQKQHNATKFLTLNITPSYLRNMDFVL